MSMILFIIMIVCVVDTCIIFSQRDEKWWKALIPGYNRYVFGKLCNSKKLGVLSGIMKIVWNIVLMFIYGFELWIAQTYTMSLYDANKLIFEVPASVKDWITILRIVMIVVAAIYMFVWSYLMNKFSQMHGKSSWWIALWAICPVIPLHYFALSKNIAMYGNSFNLERVPVHKTGKKAEKIALARRK